MIPYLDFGGSGPLLHFAHANGYPAGVYTPFLQALTAHYHVAAMPFRPLWPKQDPTQLQHWSLFAKDLIRFLDDREWQQIVGIGHSLGAVAMLFAAGQRPELFHALVMIEPVFLPPHVLEKIAGDREVMQNTPLVQAAHRRRNHWPDHQAAFERFRKKQVFNRLSDEALWFYIREGSQEAAGGGVELAFSPAWEAAIYTHVPTEVWDLIGQVTQPLLAIRAAESDTITPASWQLWQELHPAGTFIEIPESTHLVPLEKPHALARVVLGWLGEQEVKEEKLEC